MATWSSHITQMKKRLDNAEANKPSKTFFVWFYFFRAVKYELSEDNASKAEKTNDRKCTTQLVASFLYCSLHSHAHTTYWFHERSITTFSIRFICTNKCATLIFHNAPVFTEWIPSHAIDSYHRSRNYDNLTEINLYCCIVSWLLITLHSLLQPFLSTFAAHQFAIPTHLFTSFSCCNSWQFPNHKFFT